MTISTICGRALGWQSSTMSVCELLTVLCGNGREKEINKMKWWSQWVVCLNSPIGLHRNRNGKNHCPKCDQEIRNLRRKERVSVGCFRGGRMLPPPEQMTPVSAGPRMRERDLRISHTTCVSKGIWADHLLPRRNRGRKAAKRRLEIRPLWYHRGGSCQSSRNRVRDPNSPSVSAKSHSCRGWCCRLCVGCPV